MSQTRKDLESDSAAGGARDPVIDTGARRHAAAGWHYFAIFVAMIVGMILEPIPATAISFIAVTVSVLSANWVLFGAQELAEPGFKAGKEALKWGLAGFSSTTVWLVFGAFIFALGYEATGLGRRIALFW